MISNLSWILIFLSVCGIVASSPDRAIDCRKFVFAPLCRGVAAKRDPRGPGNYDAAALFEEERCENGNSIQHLLRYLYSALAFLGVDEDDSLVGTPRSKENEIENSAKSFQGRMNPLLKLFYESRGSSERDYSSAPEYENLRSIPSVLHLSRD